MSRCLSDKALMRVMAELGTPAEQAHLAGCGACALRWRKASAEIGRIRQVLLTSREPLRRAASRPWRSIAAAAGLVAIAVGALVWIEVTVWKTIQPAEDLASASQIEAALADITAAIFSVDGDPPRALAEDLDRTAPGPDGDLVSPGCDEPGWVDEAECSDTLSGLEAAQDPLEVDTTERTVLGTDGADQGE
jgi:hypothetical protein